MEKEGFINSIRSISAQSWSQPNGGITTLPLLLVKNLAEEIRIHRFVTRAEPLDGRPSRPDGSIALHVSCADEEFYPCSNVKELIQEPADSYIPVAHPRRSKHVAHCHPERTRRCVPRHHLLCENTQLKLVDSIHCPLLGSFRQYQGNTLLALCAGL
jgi:hypothetical protein